MSKQCFLLRERLQFFEKLPPAFQWSFYNVFGTEVRDEKDVLNLTFDYCGLMWEKVNNGKFIKAKDIALMRGDESVSFKSKYNLHHWPPRSVKGKETLKIIEEFHKHWHVLFMNLCQENELEIYLKMTFDDDKINDFKSLYKVADKARRKAKVKKG